MAKHLRGECDVELAGEKFTLRLALRDLEEIENLTGAGIFAIASRMSKGEARLSDARAILRQGFIGASIKIADAKFASLLEGAGFGPVMTAAAALLLKVLFDDSTAETGTTDAAR